MSEVVHAFYKDEIPRHTVNQLLKRLVREICRRASVRAAHREVRGYSTVGGRFPLRHPTLWENNIDINLDIEDVSKIAWP